MDKLRSCVGLSDKILDYINGRKQDKLEKFDKDTVKGVKAAKPEELAAYEQQRHELRVQEEAKFAPAVWLTDAAKRASQLQLVTHALKFTHSDAKGTSLFAPANESEQSYIATHSLAAPAIDIVGNAAALDVGKLLMLEADSDTKLVHFIQQDNPEPLAPFAKTPQQLTEWLEGFKLAITAKDPASHKLAKQLYWPVDDDYHLLLPLFASSLTHELYGHVQHARFSEEQKTAREARRNKKYSAQPTVDYPAIAVQAFGGTKPQNISQLNSRRGGKAFLLNSAPPKWEAQEKPPLKVKSVFRGPFSRKSYGKTKALREFLERKLYHASTKEIRDERARRVGDIVDHLVIYGASVQQLKAGWSADPECYLPMHQKLWLDPHRKEHDKDFEYEFDKKEWQAEVAADFSRFLNSELEKGKKLAMGDAEYAQWKVLTAQVLRLIKADMQGALDG
ncbi:MAG: type I-F CRISPR-associated protein Csy1 [Pontibacterium sp.]